MILSVALAPFKLPGSKCRSVADAVVLVVVVVDAVLLELAQSALDAKIVIKSNNLFITAP